MSNRPDWWHRIADRLTPLRVPHRLWVCFAVLVLDEGKGFGDALRYWRYAKEHADEVGP